MRFATSSTFVLGWTLTLSLLVAAPALAADGWSLAKDEDGIEVYTRPVPGSGIKEFKGIAVVQAAAEDIFRVLRDSENFKNWFPNTSESRLLERNEAFSVQYSVMDAPWPVSDRDNVLRSITKRDPETGEILISVRADPDFYPEQTDRVRVRQAKGSWRLEPLGPSRTRVTFVMHLEPGGGVPEWLTNARVVDSPFEALGNLRGAVRK